MRTNVVIDDKLMGRALKMSGCNTKKQVVEEGLQLLINFHSQRRILKYRGKLKWRGNLEEMRRDK